MFVMTTKINKKKLAIIFAAIVVSIAALILLISGGIYWYAHTPDKKAPKAEVRPC